MFFNSITLCFETLCMQSSDVIMCIHCQELEFPVSATPCVTPNTLKEDHLCPVFGLILTILCIFFITSLFREWNVYMY